ncbi:hypothetical protein roselon_01734 [Roseibacterium elongatum DSM 19469]|uniref:Uncharacterized protein n=1 Tax=Roseicyclus elongatus DSM 19469 TaxID=1294273 RepID=W8S5J2_9RHOB|nr:hypothetical protein [Roseibacterium elongatum]AHM04101.1 hypothetical protein roselon_01734 [Roseibacterium elongatum DSM 19469]
MTTEKELSRIAYWRMAHGLGAAALLALAAATFVALPTPPQAALEMAPPVPLGVPLSEGAAITMASND